MTPMSTQRPTPRSFRRRLPILVVAASVAAAIWSCSSSGQNGYDAEIPLINETNLDGQTKTLPPISVAVSLSGGNPSYDLGFAQTQGYAGLLRQLLSAETADGFVMAMDGLEFEADGTVDFFVEVLSRIGRISGRPLGYQPVSPASCSFTLDPASSGDAAEEYASNVKACITDWIQENGIPYEFDMRVNSAGAGGSLPAAAQKSGFAPKADASFYLFSGTWNMRSENFCDFGIDVEVLDAIIEGEDFFGLLDCSSLLLAGEGDTDSIVVLSGGASIWDACGNPLNYAEIPPTVFVPGTYFIYATAAEAEGKTIQNVVVDFLTDPFDFTEDLLSAASGACVDEPDTDGMGFAIVDWTHCGEVPREGEIRVVAAGFCSAGN